MSTDRETTRIVRSWLEEGVTALPDPVLDAVLDQLPTTHQRRATWWPVRRLTEMNKAMAFGIAAAAVVIVAILGLSFFSPAGLNIGGPPEPTPIPTSTPEPRALTEGAQGPGTFSTLPYGENPVPDPPLFTFDMPAGWTALRSFLVVSDGDDGAALLFLQPSGIYSDPCLNNTGAPDVAVGSTAEEFASALANNASYDATVIGDVTIDGHAGVRMELVMPTDLDYSTCENGEYWVWDAPLLSETPNRWELVILDLGGTTAVLLSDVTSATPESLNQVEQMLRTIQIQP